ncbi:DUF2840 domain-containing protein [Mesorhizobium sp. ORM8.1]
MIDIVNYTSGGSVRDAAQKDGLTRVELIWSAKRIEFWLRFGTVDREQILDRRRRVVSFRPGTTFAFVRWAANGFGTVISRLDVVLAVSASQPYRTLPFVRPGGDILLTVQGWQNVERVLQAIDAIECIGIDPEAVSPDHWRHVHHRMAAGEAARTYTSDLHFAYLLRRRVQP